MQVEVNVAQVSEVVARETLVAWGKKAGEPVKRDENLIDVETDKVVLELPAPADGVLVKIVKNDGESVTSGEVIAVIDTEGKASATAAVKPAEKEAVVPAKAGTQPTPAQSPPASPSAANIGVEKGIDTSTVQGTSRH